MSMEKSGRRRFLQGAASGVALAGMAGRAPVRAAEIAGAFDVKSMGATGDGKTVDSPAIDRAIAAASAAGGGTVRFSAGNYLCYTIHLKSNVVLYLDQGAKIVAADSPAAGDTNTKAYDLAEPNEWDKFQDYGHSHWRNSLIWGEGVENVSILGPGLIWGKGLSSGRRDGPRAEQAGVGNKAIALKNCHNITLRDFSILHGGHFGILATGADNLTIDNLKIDTNRDAIDIDCCKNVRVSNCVINSPWDDGICPKSSYALGSFKPTEFVTITNCYVTGCYEEGTVLDGTYKRFGPEVRIPRNGRIKFGTESNGGFRNITISNCVFDSCQGLALESVDGALLEDITITNISMRDIVNMPIFLRLGSRMRGPAGTPVGTLRRIVISNIVCSNAASRAASIISGIPGHAIEDVKLSGILIQHRGGGTAEDATLQPAELEDKYPEPTMFGGTPSHGFYIRHVKGLEMDNVEVIAAKEDARPAFVLDDVKDCDFSGIKAPVNTAAGTFVLKGVEGFTLTHCKTAPDTRLEKADQKKV
jgi:polygalacturonase